MIILKWPSRKYAVDMVKHPNSIVGRGALFGQVALVMSDVVMQKDDTLTQTSGRIVPHLLLVFHSIWLLCLNIHYKIREQHIFVSKNAVAIILFTVCWTSYSRLSKLIIFAKFGDNGCFRVMEQAFVVLVTWCILLPLFGIMCSKNRYSYTAPEAEKKCPWAGTCDLQSIGMECSETTFYGTPDDCNDQQLLGFIFYKISRSCRRLSFGIKD